MLRQRSVAASRPRLRLAAQAAARARAEGARGRARRGVRVRGGERRLREDHAAVHRRARAAPGGVGRPPRPRHARSSTASDPRFVLATKAEHGACPEMVTPEVVARIGPVDTIVCHTDFDGLCSAAKWLRGGDRAVSGRRRRRARHRHAHRARRARSACASIAPSARGRATRRSSASSSATSPAGLRRRVALGDHRRGRRGARAIEELTRQDRRRLQASSTCSAGGALPAGDALARRSSTRPRSHGKYDKTQLLLIGQERASLAIVVDTDNVSLAARYGSGVSFLELLGLSGGNADARLDPEEAACTRRSRSLASPSADVRLLVGLTSASRAASLRNAAFRTPVHTAFTFSLLQFALKPSNRLAFGLTWCSLRVVVAFQLCKTLPRSLRDAAAGGEGTIDGGQGVGSLSHEGGRRGLLPERGGFTLPADQPARADDARRRLPRRADATPSASSCWRCAARGMERPTRSSSATRCATWVKLGFAKEGNIPGFYKRSDAFLLGCTVPPPGHAQGARARRGGRTTSPSQSETRLTAAEPGPAARRP